MDTNWLVFNDEGEKSVINLIAASFVKGLPYHRLSTRKTNAILIKLLECHLVHLSVSCVQNTIAWKTQRPSELIVALGNQ